jgi:mannosyltransferase OCH1-like enzyme
MIPKIIWQTHEPDYNDLLPFQKDITNTWKNLNPGWNYKYVSAEERHKYIKKYDKELYKSYILCGGINQADIWRLVVTYVYGGFYADMDSVCTMPLDDMISKGYNNEDMICSPPSHQTSQGLINNSNFGAVKNSKILKIMIYKVIKQCKDITENGHFIFFKNPGVIVWHHFCNTAIENKNNINFQNTYFSHSRDYKKTFSPNFFVTYNDEKVFYSVLSKLNNWNIYSI